MSAEHTGQAVGGHPGLGERYRDILLDRARGHVATAAAIANEQVRGLDVEQEMVVGFPIGVLGAGARHAQLMVLGSSGAGRVVGALAGSVAVALVAHAPCPTVVVRGPERRPDETAALPVVVGVDGSPVSEAAVAFAYDIASARKAPPVAVHTWRDLVADPAIAPLLDREAIETDERELLAERLAGWAEKYPDVSVRRVVTRDRPAHRLLEESANAQLVVVGSRGHGEFAGLVLGSVSNALVHKAACPVAVIRAG